MGNTISQPTELLAAKRTADAAGLTATPAVAKKTKVAVPIPQVDLSEASTKLSSDVKKDSSSEQQQVCLIVQQFT